jgi:hypothetical protein
MPFRITAALVGLLGVAAAAAAPFQDCLPPGEIREVVAAREVVSPTSAVTTARRAVPDGDVVRASLCRDASGFLYVIMALRRDGRFVQVTIDGPSGRVKNVQ